jgi:hypothetical protein
MQLIKSLRRGVQMPMRTPRPRISVDAPWLGMSNINIMGAAAQPLRLLRPALVLTK